ARPRPAADPRGGERRGNRSRDRRGLSRSHPSQERRDRDQIERRSVRGGAAGALRRARPPIHRRRAAARKPVSVGRRPRIARRAGERARAHVPVRRTRRRAHKMTSATATTGTPLATQLSGLYAIWLREVKRAIRDRGQFIGGVSRPILWVLIMG